MIKRLILIAFLLFFQTGCAAIGANQPATMDSSFNGAPMEEAAYEPVSSSPWDAALDTGEPAQNRIVVRNASLSIVVENPGKAMNAISQMAETLGGFVVTSNLYKTVTGNNREVPEANITVRVPAEKLNTAIDQITELVEDPNEDILSENVSGQDITREYIDLRSQLSNLEEAEAQLREIMGSANKTEDVLAVYQQLTQVREQIEVLKGQIQYYDEAAALSSIAVQIQAKAAVQPLEIGGWQPVGEARNAVQALINTLQFLGSVAIWLLIYIVPVGLVIFVPLRLLWLLIRRNRKNQNKKTVSPASNNPTTPSSE